MPRTPPKKTNFKENIVKVNLHEEVESRFLNYALSVITSRSLPDIRDGLKPVHRRILYTMSRLHLDNASKFRKSAYIVGEVMGKYHPHGDIAIYDSLVRLAQDFSVRYTLVEGSGNFGSLDGDPPAAMRYTECRLSSIASLLLEELPQETVEYRPNYDGTQEEPLVLPSQLPFLLLNGSSGIAVGMACNFPSHNLSEIVDAGLALIDNRSLSIKELLTYIKGPDFPTGAILNNNSEEILSVYEQGQGTFVLNSTYETEEVRSGKENIIITSIPYAVNKSKLIEKIASVITSNKLPQLVNVKDESDEHIRIVLELKSDADVKDVMAYLYKNTDLQFNFNANFTAILSNGKPDRLNLKDILSEWLNFRLEVVQKRLNHHLRLLQKRLHTLDALEKIYADVDSAVDIIKKATSRENARTNLQKRFNLDEDQANTVLDLRLYALSSYEIKEIEKETKEKKKKRSEIETLLLDEKKIWKLIKEELAKIKEKYGDKRKTAINEDFGNQFTYNAEAFIANEDTHVIFTANNWVKRQSSYKNKASIKIREGDSIKKIIRCNTQDLALFFTSSGRVLGLKVAELPSTTGYGDPMSTIVKLLDNEGIIDLLIVAPDRQSKMMKVTNGMEKHPKASGIEGESSTNGSNGHSNGNHIASQLPHCLLFISKLGCGFLLPSYLLFDVAKKGRKIFKFSDNDELLGVEEVNYNTLLYVVTTENKVSVMELSDIPTMAGGVRGVKIITLPNNASVTHFGCATRSDRLEISYDKTTMTLTFDNVPLFKRGAKGKVLSKGKITGLRKRNALEIFSENNLN